MLTQSTKTAMAFAAFIALSPVQAATKCSTLSANSGALISSNCSDIWTALDASGRFPDIFSPADDRLIPGLCFVSEGAIDANIGETPVHITSISAWTNEFMPALFGLGSDNMGTVITRWTVTGANDGKLLGEVYTRDAIDMTTSSEQDVIIDGSNRFTNAKGALRVDSFPEFLPGGAVRVHLLNLAGSMCAPE